MTAPLESGGLWQRAREASEAALRLETLRPIPYEERHLDDQGVRFLVRVAVDWERRDREGSRSKEGENPFLPYDPTMYVADIGASHVCLLNKYCVVANHLLIITRDFEPQTELLTRSDFEALARCHSEGDSLAFYNGGKTAGASQKHKHLQLVPLPEKEKQRLAPLAVLVETALQSGFPTRSMAVPGLSFAHVAAPLTEIPWSDSAAAAECLLTEYHRLRAELKLSEDANYNLLVGKTWMLLVPRSRGSYAGVSINALGFVGAFFVREAHLFDRLQDAGPWQALAAVGG